MTKIGIIDAFKLTTENRSLRKENEALQKENGILRRETFLLTKLIPISQDDKLPPDAYQWQLLETIDELSAALNVLRAKTAYKPSDLGAA